MDVVTLIGVEGNVGEFAQLGTQVGPYRILSRLAIGGMAELFLARRQSIEGFSKLVVLKRILPHFAQNEAFVRMFLNEARLAATLNHPNIANVYDIGQFQGSYFFAMEYVHGRSVHDIMHILVAQQRPLPFEHALHIVIGCCAGLHYAHRQQGLDGQPLGIVHRDVSPPNILVGYDGGVRVVDFGIAKAAAVKEVTDAGTLKGKVPYMSPEQCKGEPLDYRSDIFSLGIVLYELTMGRRLFRAENDAASLYMITSGSIPVPRGVYPNYPIELESIVMRALALDPRRRFQSALEMQVALEDFAREYKIPNSATRMAGFLEGVVQPSDRALPAFDLPNEPTGASAEDTHVAGVPRPISEGPTSQVVPEHAAEITQLGEALAQALAHLGDPPVRPMIAQRTAPKQAELFELDLDRLELEELEPARFRE